MRFFKNILASAYNCYGQFKNEEPYSASVLYTFSTHMILVALATDLIGTYSKFHLFSYVPNKLYALFIVIPIMILEFMYYSKKRVQNIVEQYNTKSKLEKTVWGTVALGSFLGPLAYFLTK